MTNLTVDIYFRDAFEESKHPRGQPQNAGEFASGSGAKQLHPAAGTGKARTTASGGSLPPHIAALKIPPAWTEVRYNPDPNADLLAVGVDSKGRQQRVYSARFGAKQAAAKFARIKELDEKFQSVFAQNEQARKDADTKRRAAADCANLIMTTGIRPGSESDTQAKVRAYGATTLEGRHVLEIGGGVVLRFTGKKGVALNLPVTNPSTAKMLLAYKKAAGDAGQLFPISEKMLLDHVHSFDGGGFKTKDFRTLLGTRTALDEVAKRPVPKDPKSYRQQVMDVAKEVARRLGNTPVVALQSYINPAAFAPWRLSNEAAT